MLIGEVQSNQQDGSSVSDKVHYDNSMPDRIMDSMCEYARWELCTELLDADSMNALGEYAASIAQRSAQSPSTQSDLPNHHASPINPTSSLPDAYSGDAGDECEE